MTLKEKVKIWALLDEEIEMKRGFEKLNKKIDGIEFDIYLNLDNSIFVNKGIGKIAEALDQPLMESEGTKEFPYKYSIKYSDFIFYQICENALEV